MKRQCLCVLFLRKVPAMILQPPFYADKVYVAEIHTQYGGVVPELASRAHQQNMVPLSIALHKANIDKEQLSAIAFTRSGINGVLLVGSSLPNQWLWYIFQ
jgi:N6-L-threonylcarbamoyladenine synthase